MVQAMLERFGLSGHANHYPHQLSGGQQQRVALARILVSAPQILLLDEPFSALDSHLRFRLEREVREVIRSFGKTVLLVSHDRDEVFRMANRIAVMENGVIQAQGSRDAVFTDPGTRSGAILTGCKNISRARLLDSQTIQAADWGVTLRLAEPVKKTDISCLGLRMHDIRPGGGENSLRCRVVEEIENPFSMTVMLSPLGQHHTALLGWELDKADWARLRREEVEIHIPSASLLLLTD